MMPLLIHLPLIFFLLFRVQRMQGDSSLLFWSAFLLRLFSAWCVGWLYLTYYSANDTWTLFQEAVKLSSVAKVSWGNYFTLLWSDNFDLLNRAGLSVVQDRSLLFIRIISVFNLFSFSSYWVVAAYFSMISFLAAWYLYQKLQRFLPETRWAIAIAILYFPSVVFWSSGIIKETLALAGIYILAACAVVFIQQRKLLWWQWLMLLPAVYTSWGLKYYWTAIFIVSVISVLIYFLAERRFQIVSRMRIPVWLAIYLSLLAGASFIHPNFYLIDFLEVVVSNHDQFIQVSSTSSVIHYHQLAANWQSILVNAPLALVSALFRPTVIEATGATAIVASIENLFLLVLTLFTLSRVKSLLTSPHRIVVWALLAYIILLASFLALSTPNFGTLSRYRVGFLPFFVYIILIDNPYFQRIQKNMGRLFRTISQSN